MFKKVALPYPKDKLTLFSLVLIIILGFAVYANSLKGEFIWDAQFLIVENTHIKSWSHLPKIFIEDIGAGSDYRFNFYRPLQMFTYMIDYSFWRLIPVGYHLTNIVLHVLVALCVYQLVNILWSDRLFSLFTGMLFVVHPVHTEAIAYIPGRADPLAALFMLLCFILYIKQINSKNTVIYILMLFSYILALLSKEYSLILPALLLLYHFSFKKKIMAKEFFSLSAIALFYILFRLTILRELLPDISKSPSLLPMRIAGFFVALTNYLRLIFFPFNLHMEYGMGSFNLISPRAIGGILILICLLTYAFKKRKSDKLVFFSISWFLVALLPVSNIYPINAYMAEHWLYFPSIGLFLILAKGLCFIWRTKKIKIIAGICTTSIIIFYSYLTAQQNCYWMEPVSFYERTLRYVSDSPRMYHNLGILRSSSGRKAEAIALFKKAIEMKPKYTKAYQGLGIIYRDLGRKDEAIALFKKAIELNPDFADTYNSLGAVYITSDIEEAMSLFKKALEINPNNAKICNNLGAAHNSLGEKDEAIALFKKAIELNPDFGAAYNSLGGVYVDLGKNEEAISILKKAIAISLNYADAYYNLAKAYRNIGKIGKAIYAYKKAIEINPDFAEAYNNLGSIYGDLGNTKKAINLYKKAVEINPVLAKAYSNLAAAYFYKKQYKLAVEYSNRAKQLGFVNSDLIKALKSIKDPAF